MIRAVLFDLDETLLDDERTAVLAQQLTCNWVAAHQGGLDAETLRNAYHTANTDFWKTYDQKTESRSGEELRTHFWLEGLRACGCPDPSLAATLAHVYDEKRAETYELFSDALPCLEALHGRYKLALVSNGATSIQMAKVKALDLERWMDAVIIAGAVGISKPDPGIFNACLDQLDCRPDEAAMVGDLLDRDILGARNAGVLPIWINRHGETGEDGENDIVPATDRVNRLSKIPPPENTISSLDELAPLLERLNAAGRSNA